MTKRTGSAVLRMSIVFAAFVMTLAAASLEAAEPADFLSVQKVEPDWSVRPVLVNTWLKNVGSRAIAAGAVRVRVEHTDGTGTDSDLRFDFLPSIGIESWVTFRSADTQIGALQPGQVYRVQHGASVSSRGVAPYRVDVEVTAVVFEDASAVGDAAQIDQLFETWRAQARTFSAWHKASRDLLTPGGSRAQLLTLSAKARAILLKYPMSRPRIRTAVPGSDEEELAYDASSLQTVVSLIDSLLAGVDTHRVNEAEACARIVEYLRIRAETAAAHSCRKAFK